MRTLPEFQRLGRRLMEGAEASVDAHGSGGLSLLQLEARYLRSEAWQGRTPRLGIWLLPDGLMEEDVDERQALHAFYFRLDLEPGIHWIPPRSFEERNLMWWLPGHRKRYPPRIPIGDPPRIRSEAAGKVGDGRYGYLWSQSHEE